jgi:hypothetical protein
VASVIDNQPIAARRCWCRQPLPAPAWRPWLLTGDCASNTAENSSGNKPNPKMERPMSILFSRERTKAAPPIRGPCQQGKMQPAPCKPSDRN